MSLYNMVNGVNIAVFFVLPMLGKHPDAYPRFRDCFMERCRFEHQENSLAMVPMGESGKDIICVVLRVGNGNRASYKEEISTLRKNPYYIEDYDDGFDATFASFIFRVPEHFLEDYCKIKEDRLREISKRYQACIRAVYPKLSSLLDDIFGCGS